MHSHSQLAYFLQEYFGLLRNNYENFSDLLFITATFFICCSQLLKKYRIFIIFCITSFILDLAGLIYSSVYLGISTANGCLNTTVTSSDSNISTTGYMYEIDYTNSFSKEIEICDNEIDFRVWYNL